MGYDPYKSVWMNPNIEYLFNEEIHEYDIQDAGFSLIKQYKLLPEEKIQELTMMGKGKERHIAVGILQRDDKEFTKRLMDKFAEIRKIFIELNGLTDNDIISVKKDAIFTTKQCSKTKFDNIIFVEKNLYSSYIRFPNVNNLEIYYSSRGIDIKGMSDKALNRHRLYMLEFIRNCIGMIEGRNSRIKRYLNEFINNYKFMELEDEYYLEFNNLSKDLNLLFNYQNIIIPLIQITMKEMS